MATPLITARINANNHLARNHLVHKCLVNNHLTHNYLVNKLLVDNLLTHNYLTIAVESAR